MRLLLPVAVSLLIAGSAYGRCDCTCIDGQMVPACTSSLEVPPLCTQQYCSVQPSISPIGPIDSQVDNPVSKGVCETVLTTNPRTGRLQPRQVCR